jgi:hypothetical protein
MEHSKTTNEIMEAVLTHTNGSEESLIYDFTNDEYDKALFDYSKYKDSEHYKKLELVANLVKKERAKKEEKRSAILGWAKDISLVILGAVLAAFLGYLLG